MTKHLAVKLFIQLVKIPSPSGNEKAVRIFVQNFCDDLGIFNFVDHAGNFHAKLPGAGETLILSAHLDTVDPCQKVKPKVKNGIICSDGTTILGADDKAGVASILSLTSRLLKERIPHRPLHIIFTIKEEINLEGVKMLNFKKIKAKNAIVLDRSAPVNSITLSAPFATSVEIECYGKSSHSRSPEQGVHAIKMFAKYLNEIENISVKGVLSNIGIVHSGTATNVIPDYLSAQGEIRSLSKSGLKKVLRGWKNEARKISAKFNGKIIVRHELIMPGYQLSRQNKFVRELSRAIIKAEFMPEYNTAMGGSDANIFNSRGITAIALGQGRTGAHSLKESIPMQAFISTERILFTLVSN